MNVILIGMPGSGKSTVGVVLAKLLGLHFCDTDLVLQQHCGKKLQEIIRTEGDTAFFRHEEEVLAALDVQNTVIATGGSADAALAELKNRGCSNIRLMVLVAAPERRPRRMCSPSSSGSMMSSKTSSGRARSIAR